MVKKRYLSVYYGNYGSCFCSYGKSCTEKEAIREVISIVKDPKHCSIKIRKLHNKGK